MATLPPASDFTGSSVTEGQFKTALTSLRSFLADLLGTDSGSKVAARTALAVPLAAKLDKSGAYTVVAADCGKVINATTGTWSLSLTAAATLGDGFHFALQNSGSGVITIDPNASETVDGATTLAIAAGRFCIVYCDGSKFSTTYSPPDTSVDLYKQVVSTDILAATGTSTIPRDSTTPTNAEGTQVASLSITPADNTNLVEVRAAFSASIVGIAGGGGGATNGTFIAALFRGTTCIAVQEVYINIATDSGVNSITASVGGAICFNLIDAPATASAVTYSIRVGMISGGGGWGVNSSGFNFGGAFDENQLILKEIAA